MAKQKKDIEDKVIDKKATIEKQKAEAKAKKEAEKLLLEKKKAEAKAKKEAEKLLLEKQKAEAKAKKEAERLKKSQEAEEHELERLRKIEEKKTEKEAKDKAKAERAAQGTDNERIEAYLELKYEFRFNTIKQKPEYRLYDFDNKIVNNKWQPVSKYFINSIKRELDSTRIITSPENIKQILESTYSEPVDPIKQYFEKLPEWIEGVHIDHIAELCRTVETANPLKWYEYLKKWLVGVVANAMTEIGCQNHVCLTLTGEQGKFKTSWLENLCPKEINNYIITQGFIDPANKDVQTYLSEFLLINLDDCLRQLNKKDENGVKNMITAPSVKYRRPYDPYITEYPHVASFMASVNGDEFLTDPTGARRFLPFRVTAIDINKAQKMNMDLVWSQAISLFKSGYLYWFNDKDTQELHEHNKLFQVITKEEELILHYFKVPVNRNEATHFYTTSNIQVKIEKDSMQRLSEKKLGECLHKLHFEKWQRTLDNQTKWVWSVITKDTETILEDTLIKDTDKIKDKNKKPIKTVKQADMTF